jgi:hypothetical protein
VEVSNPLVRTTIFRARSPANGMSKAVRFMSRL